MFKYPRWAKQKVQSKYINSNQGDDSSNNNNQESNPAQGTHRSSSSTEEMASQGITQCWPLSDPMYPRTGVSFKNICGKYGIQTHFKGNRTLKQLLVKPKDQDPKDKKSGVIYNYKCGETVCNEEYMGRHPGPWGKDTGSTSSNPPIHVYSLQTGHNAMSDNFNIIGREDQGLAKTIKESIYMRVNNPTINRNIGKFNLNHIWDRVHLNTPGLKNKLFQWVCVHLQ